MKVIQETIDTFEDSIKPAEKMVKELLIKQRALEKELDDLSTLLKQKQKNLDNKKEDRVQWCRENRKIIMEELYPKKNTFYKIDNFNIAKAEYFKSRVVQFYPHLDFNGLGENTFMVRGDVFDSDMNLLIESWNIPVRDLGKPLDNKAKNIMGKNKFVSKKTNVYVMIDHNTGYCKIGRSVKPKVRERTLQSEKPTIEMLFNKKATNKEEKQLHEIFKEKRVRGEWFDLTDKDLDTIKEYLN